jgi:hypothetical protein
MRWYVMYPFYMATTSPQSSQTRSQIPYMARFEGDWATAKIASEYASHLRSDARKNGELDSNTHYDYLKANSAKRRPGARRGTQPGLAGGRGQLDIDNGEVQNPGPSGAGPFSLPNPNTTADESMMDEPGLFGSGDPSDDEDGSGLDEDPDFQRHE